MKIRSACVLAALAIGLFGSVVRAGETLEEVRKRGVLIAGVKDRAPPFSFVDRRSGELVGYDVDVLKALSDRLGVRLELKPVDSSDRVSALVNGDVDIVAANLTRSDGRGRVIDFSDTYLTTGQGFLTRKGAVKSLQELTGKKVAAVIGSRSERNARASLPGAVIVPVEDYGAAARSLDEGSVDAVTSDRAILLDLAERVSGPGVELSPVQIADVQYVLGVREGDAPFLAVVNQTLRDLEQSGEAGRLRARWFALHPEREPRPASGAIVRRAATPPRFLAESLSGFFLPNTPVTVYAPGGDTIGKGTVREVFGDQFYVDIDEPDYSLVQPGFFVAARTSEDAARKEVARQADLLKSIKEQSSKEEAAYTAQREREGIEKEKQAQEYDRMEEESKLRLEEERAAYYGRFYYYFR